MCGIYGITTTEYNAGDKVYRGVRALEYRGYDSWGIAQRTESNLLDVTKEVGKISEAEFRSLESREAIGHSRWATHGKVTQINTHPHAVGRVTLVHNGIIENYAELKEELCELGYFFVSETDSEVLAALIDTLLSREKEYGALLRKLHSKLRGRYAFVCFIEGVSGMLAARSGSPLVVGLADSSTILTSDAVSLIDSDVSQVVYLEENHGCFICENKRTYYTLEGGEETSQQAEDFALKIDAINDKEYKHHMLREINEQSVVLKNIFNQDTHELVNLARRIAHSKKVFLIGCGTAHKVAAMGASLFTKESQVCAHSIIASEIGEYEPFIDEGDVCLIMSQSGETADVLEAVRNLEERGVYIVAITNVGHSTLARVADSVLLIHAGIERAVASTKAALNQLVLLYGLVELSHGCNPDKLDELLANLGYAIEEQLQEHMLIGINSIAQAIHTRESLFIIGRSEYYPLAQEAAIKIAEVSYIHAQAFATGELKHGPIALIEEGSVCVVLGSDRHAERAASELQARGALIVGIASTRCADFDYWIPTTGKGIDELVSSLVSVQLLAYYLACRRDLDPDMPRNLAKSVTVV